MYFRSSKLTVEFLFLRKYHYYKKDLSCAIHDQTSPMPTWLSVEEYCESTPKWSVARCPCYDSYPQPTQWRQVSTQMDERWRLWDWCIRQMRTCQHWSYLIRVGVWWRWGQCNFRNKISRWLLPCWGGTRMWVSCNPRMPWFQYSLIHGAGWRRWSFDHG